MANGLIYPVPDSRYPFLGVHLTRHHDGTVRVGPNAVLAMPREGYDWSTWRMRDVISVASIPRFYSFARKNWRTGVSEMWSSYSVAAFAAEARR